MQNHGLVVCGDTPEQVKDDTDWLLAQLRPMVAEVAGIEVCKRHRLDRPRGVMGRNSDNTRAG